MAATYPSDAKQWLAKLISFDTTSRNSNLDLIHYVRDYLQSVGITPVLVHNEERTKANLFATLPGVDGERQGGVVLSGHTDVVPVDGQDWATDPFVMVEKDGKLYGRGSADMKGGIAVVLALTPHFLSMPGRTKPIHYAFSFDEEVGCTGVPFLIDHLRREGFKADGCVVMEPTNNKLYIGHKGLYQWRVEVRGKDFHPSKVLMPPSCNAIEHAAMIITKVRAMALELRDHGERDDAYDCPFSNMGIRHIQCGPDTGTVPAECSFTFGVAVVDAHVAEGIEREVQAFIDGTMLPMMREEYPAAAVSMTRILHMPAFCGNPESPFVKVAQSVMTDSHLHKSGSGTEAGYFQGQLGIPTVLMGAGPWEVAHLANEYVELNQLRGLEVFVRSLVEEWEVHPSIPHSS